MPRIEIGAGIVVALVAASGALSSVWTFIGLGILAVFLVIHGLYDELVKPRFRVEHRLKDWFIRRGWKVRLERTGSLNFKLSISSASSGYEVVVTRERKAQDDMISFTAAVPRDESSLEFLDAFSLIEQQLIFSEITTYLTGKNMSFELFSVDGKLLWPPVVAITTAIAQDHTLSQHSVDTTAKSVELSVIGVRAVIKAAFVRHLAIGGSTEATPEPSPDSTPDTVPPELQK